MLAASKLHTDAMMYFPGHISKPVKAFYSLYKDVLPIKAPEMLHLGTVDRLIVVDTQQAARIGRFRELLHNPEVKITVYDHHPKPQEGIDAPDMHIVTMGAITSYLVGLLAEKQIELSEIEATVMALGIYADTACLTTPATTSEDVKAVAWLLEQGANLEIIARHVRNPLTEGQRELLEELLANSEKSTFNGVKTLLSVCSVDQYIDGLGHLAQQLGEIEDVDLVLCIVEMDDRVHLVGRSQANHVAVNDLLEHFGGGGHPQAASATIKGKSPAEIRQELVGWLESELRPPLIASDLMSSPVHTATQDISMEAAGKAMLRFGHSGLPVTEDGKLVGVISRRDVDKALNHGLSHAPVKAFMSSRVVTISPGATLDEIQRTLIGKDIGRLPVVDPVGQLLGIVTRTDVLRSLHGRSYPHWYQTNYRTEVNQRARKATVLTELMAETLPKRLQGVLLLIGQEAERQNVRAYLVGGIVRDMMLGVPNLDVDIVIEPAAIPFAEHLAKVIGGELKTYPQFNTATINLPGGPSIDLVTARTEFYANPAAMPDIEVSTIKQDLYRRDFTINTMAIVLNGPSYGQLLDFFGGRADLDEGAVRVLFNLSFVDDPTRMLRAVRFEQRYQFKIEPETLRFLKNALDADLLKKISGERMRAELLALFSEPHAPRMILRMDELGIWEDIIPELTLSDRLIRIIRHAAEHIEWFVELGTGVEIDRPLVYLLIISSALQPGVVEELPQRLALSKREREVLLFFQEKSTILAQDLASQDANSEIYQLVHPLAPEAQVAAAILYGEGVRRQLAHYWTNLAHVRTEANGHDLLQLGVRSGPELGKVLQNLHIARLNGMVQSKDEELEMARRLLSMPDEGR